MDMHIAPATVREIASEPGSRRSYGCAPVGELFDAATVLQVARKVEADKVRKLQLQAKRFAHSLKWSRED
ncbi:MAG TPA: hypothetical protein VJ823_12235 [Rhodanobacteraceae bacterium]|nr:hypothetical protein [Rhodanobacteraceae bacterium]